MVLVLQHHFSKQHLIFFSLHHCFLTNYTHTHTKESTNMWQTLSVVWLAMLLLLPLVQAAENATDTYKVPSFSLVLNVDKSESALIVFQDSLNSAVKQHLELFFQTKMEGTSLPNGFIEDVALTSSYVWKELSKSTDQYDSVNKYEVRAQFKCQLDVGYTIQSNIKAAGGEQEVSVPRISQSIMDLFLIEAFQGDNYWSLVHAFFKDEALESITGMKITVQADGYIHYNGGDQDPATMEQYSTRGAWSPTMIVGVFFATVFLGIMIVMWTYLCCCTRDSMWVRLNRRKQRNRPKHSHHLEKPDNTTDESNSTSSLHPDDDDYQAESWMDVWAKSVTSIPLREPVKARKIKKKAASIRRPAQHHCSSLNAIVEIDDDGSTVCSAETQKSRASSQHSRIISKQAAIMEAEISELEEGQLSIPECDDESDEYCDDEESVSTVDARASPTQRHGSRKTGDGPCTAAIV